MIASLITALYLAHMTTAAEAALFLYVYGALLLIAEIFLVSFGLLALNGMLAVYVAYVIQTGDNLIFGLPLGWPIVFGIAFAELAAFIVAALVLIRNRRLKVTTGKESMIGSTAAVLEWSGTKGRVMIQGEPWKAYADTALELAKDAEVTITEVQGLKVKITA